MPRNKKVRYFSVMYETTTGYEAVVRAKDEKEAREKVIDVIGDDANITDSWEVRNKND